MSNEERPEGPEFEMWIHLESGLDIAEDDMRRQVSEKEFEFWDALAKQLLALRVGLIVNPNSITESAALKRLVPHATPEVWQQILLSLDEDPSTWSPWLRHAVELRIAGSGVGRAEEALQRYSKLRAAIVGREVPEKASRYLQEVLQTYLFGFDAAAIALACSVFEQMARHTLTALGLVTEPELRRDQPTADGLRIRLRQHDLLGAADTAAQRLIERRNSVLHKGLFDDRIMPTLSRDSVKELVEVAIALSPSWKASS
jgi:hypothetical protein